MKKVLFVASGKSFHAVRWANSLEEMGFEIHFFSNAPMVRSLNEGVKVYDFSGYNSIGYFLNAPKLRRIIKSVDPDIVHAHYSSGNGILATLALLGLDKVFITSLYGAEVFDFPNKSFIHKFLLKQVCLRADKVLSTSKVMAKEFLTHYPNLEAPIVTPFGVDTEKFKCNFKQNDKTQIVIGMVKKLEIKYGVDVFLNAANVLLKKHNKLQLKFKIVGGGSQERELKSLAAKLNIDNDVEFLGWLPNDDIPIFLNTLDIFVVPSRHRSESFGVAAVEAQSCGIPVLVSDIGGLPEVIDSDVTGLLFEPGNVEDLVKTTDKLILNENLRNTMSVEGPKRVKKLYDWSCSLRQMASIYGTTIDEVMND